MGAFLTAFFLVFGAALVLAQEVGTSSTAAPAYAEPRETTYSLGFAFADYKYSEPGVMTTQGSMSGIQFSMKYHPFFQAGYFGFRSELFTGILRYDGSVSYVDSNTNTMVKEPHSEDSSDYFYNLQPYYGYHIPFDRSASAIDLGIGFGHWYLNDQGETPASYEREQVYQYLPLSVTYKKSLKQNWTVEIAGESDVLVKGKNSSHVKPSTLEFQQTSGSGSKLSAALLTRHQRSTYRFELSHRTWDIGKSNIVPGWGYDSSGERVRMRYWEPKNDTSMTTLAFAVLF